VDGGRPENLEKNMWSKDQLVTQPTCNAGSGNRTRATVVGVERSNRCTTPAPCLQIASTVNYRASFIY